MGNMPGLAKRICRALAKSAATKKKKIGRTKGLLDRPGVVSLTVWAMVVMVVDTGPWEVTTKRWEG